VISSGSGVGTPVLIASMTAVSAALAAVRSAVR